MSAVDVIRQYLSDAGLAAEEPTPGHFVVVLEGETKLRTTVSLVVGTHSVGVNAFVARRPDENHAVVYRWLLERNLKMLGIAYCLDREGDIYLAGRIPVASVTSEVLDQILGAVLIHADGDFNTILELGFARAITEEWRWRLARGESTRHLEGFARLAPRDPDE
ncbi:MAG: YbjN domain-containing protein [Candidatus Nanopelagicales bacterium]|nr:YbjN domain-containing protein [Candidatus Nanopelagicales bacterium]MDZ4249015.1 YbjN domain-containing protein [Candidatus Nanopelagicales bacterium]